MLIEKLSHVYFFLELYIKRYIVIYIHIDQRHPSYSLHIINTTQYLHYLSLHLIVASLGSRDYLEVCAPYRSIPYTVRRLRPLCSPRPLSNGRRFRYRRPTSPRWWLGVDGGVGIVHPTSTLYRYHLHVRHSHG